MEHTDIKRGWQCVSDAKDKDIRIRIESSLKEKFSYFLKRESDTPSAWLRRKITEYVKQHNKGVCQL